MTILYNCHHDGDQYRITKFTDGNPESSYLCTFAECTCPASHRPTCRHRQMLPLMIAHNIINTHWFWNYDLSMATDFEGQQVSLYETKADAPAEEDTYGTSPFILAGGLNLIHAENERVHQVNLAREVTKPWRRL